MFCHQRIERFKATGFGIDVHDRKARGLRRDADICRRPARPPCGDLRLVSRCVEHAVLRARMFCGIRTRRLATRASAVIDPVNREHVPAMPCVSHCDANVNRARLCLRHKFTPTPRGELGPSTARRAQGQQDQSAAADRLRESALATHGLCAARKATRRER